MTKLFYTSTCKHLANKINLKKGKFIVEIFSDGEIYVRVKENVKNKTVNVLASFFPPTDNLMEMALILDALKREKANVNLIIPYLGYSRQDRQVAKGEAVGAEVVCDIIKSFRPKKITVIDIHSPRLHKFMKFTNIVPLSLFAEKFKTNKKIKDFVVVAPDYGAIQHAKKLAKQLRCSAAFLEKQRKKHNIAEIIGIRGNVKGKNILIIDDLIDTGGTIIEAAKFLKKKGAEDIYVAATHGLFSGNAVKRLEKSAVKMIYVTDTIPQKKKSRKINIIPISNTINKF